MWFAALMFITTLAIAVSAGYISVIGFANTFSATFWQALALATSLEFGKLVAASFLYRYWKSAQFVLKSVMIFAVAGLMVFTSAGIYGYLTSSYQTSSLTLDTTTQQVAQLEEEKERLSARKKEIDAQITELPINYVTARRQLMSTFGAELEQLNTRLPVIDAELIELKKTTIQEEAHVGPIIFVAQTFGVDSNKAMNYFILLVVLVFDPLAVAMTLATNHVILQVKIRREESNSKPGDTTNWNDVFNPTTTTAPAEQSPIEPTPLDPLPTAPLPNPEAAPDTTQPTQSDPQPDLSPVILQLTQAVGSLDTSLKKMAARRNVVDDMRSNSLT